MAGSGKHYSARRRPFRFHAPRNNRFFTWLAQAQSSRLLRRMLGVEKVEISDEDLSRLKNLKGERVILTPNHPSLDPVLIFHLSKLLGMEFNYLAADEVFKDKPASRVWLLQRLGAYSVVRGTPDRKSFDMTQKLLREGKRFLVIFPEGITCWQNDTVLPFQFGTAQFAFWALEDLAREGREPPLYIVPVAIRYAYLQDMRPAIRESLTRLEQELHLRTPAAHTSLDDRLLLVGEAVLSANERGYNVRPDPQATLDGRIQFMKELIVGRISDALGVSLQPSRPLRDRVRELVNHLDRIIYGEPWESEYDRKLQEEMQQKIKGLYDDLDRVFRFIAIADPGELLTAEQFLDILGRLEREVLKTVKVWGPRKAVVKVGEPVNLRDHFPRYLSDKRGAISAITLALEDAVRGMLAGLVREHSSALVE